MFSGIIETVGTVVEVAKEGTNKHLTIEADFNEELYIDQSIAHNGVCLTVVEINGNRYTVTAIEETLSRSNLNQVQKGDAVNLERATTLDTRMDGHMVQGHVDKMVICEGIEDRNGSWEFTFSLDNEDAIYLVDKGSITLNGVSLTVVAPTATRFKVDIIPYTYEHTNFKHLKPGDAVNIEFEIIGKYVARYMQLWQKHNPPPAH